MIAASPVTPPRIAARVPCPPSSSPGTNATTSSPRRRRAAPVATIARTAATIAATPPFMSHAPRPYRRPSVIAPDQGSTDHVAASPGGGPAAARAPPLLRGERRGVLGQRHGARIGATCREAIRPLASGLDGSDYGATRLRVGAAAGGTTT